MDELQLNLPKVRGKYRYNAKLAKTNWLQVGGPADVLFKPADIEDLSHFLKEKPYDMPVVVLGVGSNIIIRDGGVDGVVIKLGQAFAGIDIDGEYINAGAAAMDLNVARFAANNGLAGLEFFSGIPGTIGGAIAMNAGAYGHEVKDALVSVKAVNNSGEIREFSNQEIGFSYRANNLGDGWVFVSARFKAEAGDSLEIKARMAEITKKREETQPIRMRTGGSTFANPEGKKAWELVEAAGCRGLQIGDAQISEKHCNFMINHAESGNGKAADLEALGEEVKRRVKENSGVDLHWEIKRIGREDG